MNSIDITIHIYKQFEKYFTFETERSTKKTKQNKQRKKEKPEFIGYVSSHTVPICTLFSTVNTPF